MKTTKISGVFTTPAGTVLPNVNLILTAISTSNAVLETASASCVTDAEGQYSFDVPSGYYAVTVAYDRTPRQTIGRIRVFDDSEPATLNAFLDAPSSEPSPEWMNKINNAVADAECSAMLSDKSAKKAQSAIANIEENVAASAQSAADASESKAAADAAKASAESSATAASASADRAEAAVSKVSYPISVIDVAPTTTAWCLSKPEGFSGWFSMKPATTVGLSSSGRIHIVMGSASLTEGTYPVIKSNTLDIYIQVHPVFNNYDLLLDVGVNKKRLSMPMLTNTTYGCTIDLDVGRHYIRASIRSYGSSDRQNSEMCRRIDEFFDLDVNDSIFPAYTTMDVEEVFNTFGRYDEPFIQSVVFFRGTKTHTNFLNCIELGNAHAGTVSQIPSDHTEGVWNIEPPLPTKTLHDYIDLDTFIDTGKTVILNSKPYIVGIPHQISNVSEHLMELDVFCREYDSKPYPIQRLTLNATTVYTRQKYKVNAGDFWSDWVIAQ